MAKAAIMFGSIGAVTETSDVQRRAYNAAMKEAGLEWEWDTETYADLLLQTGGKERLAHLAAATGKQLSNDEIDRIHTRKTEIACLELVNSRIKPRPGVIELLALAKQRGMKVAFVTTTYQPNIDAIFEAADGALRREDFDHIVNRDEVPNGKPAPDAYEGALRALGLTADDAVAIEDTAVSVMSAKRAGITVIATPGAITGGQDFWQADLVVGSLLGPNGAVDQRVVAMLD